MSAKQILKVALAAGILVFVALRVDLSAAFALIADADLARLSVAIFASLLIIVADAAFWAHAMRPVGLKMAFRTALLFGIVGWFFATLSPSNVGSDLFRAAQMRYAGATTDRSIRLVAAARLMSLAALIAVIGAGLPYALMTFDDARDRIALATIFAIAVSAFSAFVLLGPLAARLPSHWRLPGMGLVAGLAADTRTLLAKTALSGWFLLIVQHLLRVAGVALVAWSLAIDIKLLALFALVSPALLVAMVPLSIGGWGVREASFVYFLGFAGVAAPAALAISIVFGLTRIIIGAIGGIVWTIARADQYKFAVDAPDAATKIEAHAES